MFGKDQDPHIGKDTQFREDNQPANKGRKPSIKKELERIALSDGWIEFPTKDVEILEDKVRIKIPKQDALAMKLWSWAMSKKGNDSIKAIQMIMEQFDGKATQGVEISSGPDIKPAFWTED